MTTMVLRDAAALDMMTAARTWLLLNQPWWGSLALRLKLVEVPDPIYMATDGTSIFYNAAEVLAQVKKVNATVIAHEVMHCALIHVFRLGGRDLALWNIACDHVVNLSLKESGFEFPTGKWSGIADARFKGMSAEQVYAILKDEQRKQDGGQGGSGQGGAGQDHRNGPRGLGQDLREPSESSGEGDGPSGEENGPQTTPGEGSGPTSGRAMSATDWEIAAEQATMVAQKAGRLPGGLERLVKEARKPKVDWVAVLRRFVEHNVPSDYSWTSPNRRQVWQGIYLPGTHKENTARGVVAIDTSGSVSQRMLDQAAGELTSLLQECRPESMTVVYCDAAVQGKEQVFTPDDGYVKLEMRGGGGTAFQPVFDWVAEHFADEPPAFLVYLTDLYASDIDQIEEPPYPVLFATTTKTTQTAPFGETVHCEVE